MMMTRETMIMIMIVNSKTMTKETRTADDERGNDYTL